MKPAIKMAGIFRPTAATMRPMLAVSVYPGATDEMPSTAPEKVPTLPDASPLESSPADSSATLSSLSAVRSRQVLCAELIPGHDHHRNLQYAQHLGGGRAEE